MKRRFLIDILAISLIVAGIISIQSVYAALTNELPQLAPEAVNGTRANTLLFDILNNITNVVLGVLVAVAVIFAIYSGYLYLTAQGDAAKVQTASTMLIYAGVAVGVGLLSKGVINLVLGILNTTTKI